MQVHVYLSILYLSLSILSILCMYIYPQTYKCWADICVGQLAGENGISAQIMFHTSLDSPATQLKIYGNLLSLLCHHI